MLFRSGMIKEMLPSMVAREDAGGFEEEGFSSSDREKSSSDKEMKS